jgi:hypothetical protein
VYCTRIHILCILHQNVPAVSHGLKVSYGLTDSKLRDEVETVGSAGWRKIEEALVRVADSRAFCFRTKEFIASNFIQNENKSIPGEVIST